MPSFKRQLLVAFVSIAASPFAYAQARNVAPADLSAPAFRQPYFGKVADLGLTHLLVSAPAAGSQEAAVDLAEVYRLQNSRTPDQVRAAQYDDLHEDIFVYATSLKTGSGADAEPLFTAANLPLLRDFSAHIRSDAGLIDNPLKAFFRRLRPYNFDARVHPVCEVNKEFSYPSGHSINGFLYAFALTEILPEQSDRILSRAQQYANNRVVCGVHYPSDIEASRKVASFVFGYLLAQPTFQHDLEAAKQEVRSRLLFSSQP